MQERMNKKELLKLLSTLKIDKKEFWILSSSQLVLRDIYPNAGDLDIAVTDKGLEELKKNYDLVKKENGWYMVNSKVECVLRKVNKQYPLEECNGYYLQNINEYYKYLIASKRQKDILRIPIVEEYIKKINK